MTSGTIRDAMCRNHIIDAEVMARGWLRYEKLRTLNLNEITKIYKRNLAGEHFDAIVDEYVEGRHD